LSSTQFFEKEEVSCKYPGVIKINNWLYLYQISEREYHFCKEVRQFRNSTRCSLVGVTPLHRKQRKYYTPLNDEGHIVGASFREMGRATSRFGIWEGNKLYSLINAEFWDYEAKGWQGDSNGWLQFVYRQIL
jgi:hypothetical protein